jgi:hypothetical protein
MRIGIARAPAERARQASAPSDTVREASSGDVAHFGLLWRTKRSLLAYVRRLPDGRISVDGGVGLTLDLAFHFPLEDDACFDSGTCSGMLRFRGAVHLYGHLGVLSVVLAAPVLHVRPDGMRLSIDSSGDPTTGLSVDLVEGTDAHVDAGAGVLELAWSRPLLTAAGAALLGGVYPAGTVFDPLAVRVPVPGESG